MMAIGRRIGTLALPIFLALMMGPMSFADDGASAQHERKRPPANISSDIVFFYYKDVDTAAPFYERVMGLEKTLDLGWIKIYALTSTASVGITQEGHGFHKASKDKPAMLSIVTDDVDAWYRRLKDEGVPILSDLPAPDDMPSPDEAPIRGFIAADPGGYTIEFFSWR